HARDAVIQSWLVCLIQNPLAYHQCYCRIIVYKIYYPFTTLFGYKSPTDLLFHCCWFLFTFKSNTNRHHRSRLFIYRAYITTKLAFLFSRPIFITQFTEEFLTTVLMAPSSKIHTKNISPSLDLTHHI